MNRVVHLVRKDLLGYWRHIALVLVALLADYLGTYYFGLFQSAVNPFASILPAMVRWVLTFLVTVAIVQEDRLFAPNEFWLTRPIRPRTLLASKLVLLGAILVLPAFLGTIALALAAGGSFGLSLLVGIETAATVTAMALVTILLAATTRSILQACAVIVVLWLAVVVVVLAVQAWWPGLHLPRMSPGVSVGTRALVGMVLAIGGLAVVLDVTYRKRRYATTIPLVLALAALVLIGVRYWPVSLIPEPAPLTSDAPAADAAGAANAHRVKLIPRGPAQTRDSRVTYVGKPPRPVRVQEVSVPTELELAVPDRYVEATRIATVLTAADGSTHTYGNLYQHNIDQRQRYEALRLTLGLPPQPRKWTVFYPHLTLLELGEGENPAPPDHPARLDAKVNLVEHRYDIDVTLPLRAGATLRRPGELWRVDVANLRDDGAMHVILRCISPTSVLHPIGRAAPGSLESSSIHAAFGLVLRNRRLHEFAVTATIGRRKAGWSSGLETVVFEYVFDRYESAVTATPTKGFDRAWLDDAEVVLLTSRLTGEWTQDYAIDGFYLERNESVRPFWK